MKTLILLLAILLTGCASMGDAFYEVGLEHNFHETDINNSIDCIGPINFRAQLGFDVKSIPGLSYGLGHVSDLKCGKPFRNDMEYTNDYFFAKYKGYL